MKAVVEIEVLEVMIKHQISFAAGFWNPMYASVYAYVLRNIVVLNQGHPAEFRGKYQLGPELHEPRFEAALWKLDIVVFVAQLGQKAARRSPRNRGCNLRAVAVEEFSGL